MARFGNQRTSLVNRAIGQIVGLLLFVFVLDALVGVFIPQLYGCTNSWHDTYTTVNLTAYKCQNASGLQVTPNSYFGVAATIVQQLLAPLAILAVFAIIMHTLKKMNMQ